MFHARIYCGLNCGSSCDQVDTAELCRLSGAGMRHADEVYERVCRGDFFDIGALIEGVSRYQRAASAILDSDPRRTKAFTRCPRASNSGINWRPI